VPTPQLVPTDTVNVLRLLALLAQSQLPPVCVDGVPTVSEVTVPEFTVTTTFWESDNPGPPMFSVRGF
jgi:hypothetical protein